MAAAHNILNEYIDKYGIKHRVFAERIGTSTCTLHNILKKGHVPNLGLAYEIEKKTNGRITLYDWILSKQSSDIGKYHHDYDQDAQAQG